MTLWNLIRDFFVENIFGGTLSNAEYIVNNKIGYMYSSDFSESGFVDSMQTLVNVGQVGDSNNEVILNFISFGDWLSTTFTIITLILLVIFLYIFVKWIFKLFSGLLH